MAASGAHKGDEISEQIQAPEANVRILQVNGLVKWFDVARGYGFIIPDNGMQDILLHLSCLKRDGFEAPLEGARLTCEVVRRQNGFQCLRVLAVDLSKPFQPIVSKSRTQASVVPTTSWVRVKG